ncbi:hypothetical protein NKH48_03440 [Mesorhizobium sp. M1233]|uniref:hypothetical protein n=1 Tax=Mesorhizobium sp. M1233 TaxID=2957072 RepID=UPI00333A320B
MTDFYAYWREEQAQPGVNARDTDRRDLAGFYRMKGAKTKPDYPVALWMNAAEKLLLKVGRQKPIEEKTDAFWDFLGSGWFHCIAVEHAEYLKAFETGEWSDGKPARQVEKVVEPPKEPEQAPAPQEVANAPSVRIPGVPVAAGDNGGPPLGQEIAEQVKAENLLLNQLTATPVTDKDTAEKVGECVNRLRALKSRGEKEHEIAKAPWLEGGRIVDNAFNPSVKAAAAGIKLGADRVTAFLRAEQARLEAIALVEAAAKQAELNRQAKEQAELAGKPVEEVEVRQVQPKQVLAKVGGAAGRSITANQRRHYRAEITNFYALLDALKDEPAIREAVEAIAHRLANTKDAAIPAGMKVVEAQQEAA